jgi:hypothetical protein
MRCALFISCALPFFSLKELVVGTCRCRKQTKHTHTQKKKKDMRDNDVFLKVCGSGCSCLSCYLYSVWCSASCGGGSGGG